MGKSWANLKSGQRKAPGFLGASSRPGGGSVRVALLAHRQKLRNEVQRHAEVVGDLSRILPSAHSRSRSTCTRPDPTMSSASIALTTKDDCSRKPRHAPYRRAGARLPVRAVDSLRDLLLQLSPTARDKLRREQAGATENSRPLGYRTPEAGSEEALTVIRRSLPTCVQRTGRREGAQPQHQPGPKGPGSYWQPSINLPGGWDCLECANRAAVRVNGRYRRCCLVGMTWIRRRDANRRGDDDDRNDHQRQFPAHLYGLTPSGSRVKAAVRPTVAPGCTPGRRDPPLFRQR